MSNLIPVSNGLIGLLHSKGSVTLSKPFEREILLIPTYIAGTTHIPEIAELVKKLSDGEVLTLRREPSNKHDELAILVLRAGEDKLGYVPRAVNGVLARLMDAGKHLYAKITAMDVKDTWHCISIDVLMRD